MKKNSKIFLALSVALLLSVHVLTTQAYTPPQTCSANKFFNGITAAGTFTCTTSSGGASSTVVNSINGVTSTQVGVNVTSSLDVSYAATWTALESFNGGLTANSTATFNSSTVFSVATNTLLSANSTGKLQTTTFAGAGLSFAGNTLTWTNPSFVTAASSVTWTALQTFTSGATFNSTATFNSSTIIASITNSILATDSTGKIVATTTAAGGGSITTSTPLVSGQVDFSSGASTIANDANFTWASSTKILNVTSTGRYNIGNVVAVMMPGTTNALFGGSGNLGTNIGIQNTAMGVTALDFLTTGGNNSAFGYSSLIVNTSGTSNNAFGANALQAITTASNNSAFGESAGFSATASGSIFLGYNAGKSLTIGSNDIMIGYNTDFPQTSSSNMLDIANLIYATGLSNFASVTSTVSAGSVGIGTQSPSSTLHVIGQVIATTNVGIGSTTNSGLLNVVNASNTVALNVATTTGATSSFVSLNVKGNASTSAAQPVSIFQIFGSGHINSTGTVPTVSSCGAGSPSVKGSDSIGTITLGTGGISSCKLTFQIPYETSNVVCMATDSSSTDAVEVTTITSSSATFGFAVSIAGGSVYYMCGENF